MRVMLVDDRLLVRNGIASLLRARGHEVVAEAGNGLEALETVGQVLPDLILMDIRMPQMNGLEATRLIKAQYPDMKIVMLTVSDDEQDLFEAIKSGAHGYLLKDLEATQFFEALEDIATGQAVLPTRLAGKLLEEFRSQARRAGGGGGGGASQQPRAGRPDPGGPGAHQQRGGRQAVHQREHCQVPHEEHPGQAAFAEPRPGDSLGG